MGGQTRNLKWSLDDLDLSKPIEPISRFIDDPEKLIDEVFKIAAQYLSKDIVPSSLKDIPTVELKKLCLEQLKKIERKTLLNILSDETDEIVEDDSREASSSDRAKVLNESAGPSSDQPRPNTKVNTKDIQVQVELATISADTTKDDHGSSAVDKKKDIGTKSALKDAVTKTDSDSKKTIDCMNESNPDSILDQAELEIRELELRAQAIRELLKKHENVENQTRSQSESESQKESRKRLRVDVDTQNSSQTEINSSKSIQKGLIIDTKAHRNDRKTRDKVNPALSTKAKSRLSINPVSMVEDDESDELPSSSCLEEKNNDNEDDEDNDEEEEEEEEKRKRVRRKRSIEESNTNENNIMIQLTNDGDDSIDRELKGE